MTPTLEPDASTPLLWAPSKERVEKANLTAFIKRVQQRFHAPVQDYPTLYRWSLEYPENFWTTLWEFCDVHAAERWTHVLLDANRMPGAQWFTGATLNFAEHLLRYEDDAAALIFRNERGDRRELSFKQLKAEVARIAAGLRELGIKPGDRIVGFMPNVPETVVAMLAATSLGATWSSCSPDFGLAGVLDRFGQIAPRVLFAADGYWYSGKTIDSLPIVRGIVANIPSIERVILTSYIGAKDSLSQIDNAVAFEQFGHPGAKLSFTYLPFNHPLYIAYSSGTTGAPKCIVHCAGGILLQHLKEHVLHADLKRGDRMLYFTTCGWIMWNWLVSALASGVGVVLYDGSPLHPDASVLWRVAAEERVQVFGTSPRFLNSSEKAGLRPSNQFDLSHLRVILSTGSPLPPESYQYVYRDVKQDIQLSSMAGGTDIAACFATGCPILPVYEGQMQCRALAMKVEVYDEQGHSIERQMGELVCTAPFPSMPIGYWNDPTGERYRSAYFERFPNVWCHGDHAMITEHSGVVITGRSDAVLNPSGVRIGTAELYRQLATIDEVVESLAIAQEWQNDVRIVLFVRLREGLQLDEALREKIRQTIRRNASPRHVPAKIIQAPDLPQTTNGKLAELAVRNVVHGKPVTNAHALTNPQSLEFFRDIPELKT